MVLVLHTEDAPGGLLIVHTPEQTDPFTSQRAASSQPTQLSQSKPPSKKFRAGSQPLASSSRPSKPPSHSQSLQSISRKPSTSSRLLEDEEAVSHSDADVERDVRAMEDEADRLRRQSRARALLDQSLLAPTFNSSQGSGTDNSVFNFPPPSTSKSQFKPPSASKPKTAGRGRTKLAITPMEVDTQVPIPQNETPQQQRNKRLREGAMAAIREEQEAEEERGRGKGSGSAQRSGSRRRASSLSRGKRISTSYQQTGVISACLFLEYLELKLTDSQLNRTTRYPRPASTNTSTRTSQKSNGYDSSSSGVPCVQHQPTTNLHPHPRIPWRRQAQIRNPQRNPLRIRYCRYRRKHKPS